MMTKVMEELPAPVSTVSRIPLEAFAGQCQRSLRPLVDRISYFSTVALEDDQIRQFLRELAEAGGRAAGVRYAEAFRRISFE